MHSQTLNPYTQLNASKTDPYQGHPLKAWVGILKNVGSNPKPRATPKLPKPQT